MLQGCSWCDVLWKIPRLCCGILDPRVMWSVVVRFISFSVPMSSSANGPLAQAAKRCQASSRGQPNDGRNESFPCVHGWSGLCIACPYPCWHCFDGSMRYVATHDQLRHGLLMCLFCQLLSDNWHRVASFVKTKSVLIGCSLNRLNRMR